MLVKLGFYPGQGEGELAPR